MTGGIKGVGRGGAAEGAAAVGRGTAARGTGAGFAMPAGGTAGPAAAGIGAAEAAPLLGVMLALQEAGAGSVAERARDRAARRHAEAMLGELRTLQLEILGRAASGAALERLAGLARDLPEAADAGLAATLGWLAVRARIELARRES